MQAMLNQLQHATETSDETHATVEDPASQLDI